MTKGLTENDTLLLDEDGSLEGTDEGAGAETVPETPDGLDRERIDLLKRSMLPEISEWIDSLQPKKEEVDLKKREREHVALALKEIFAKAKEEGKILPEQSEVDEFIDTNYLKRGFSTLDDLKDWVNTLDL